MNVLHPLRLLLGLPGAFAFLTASAANAPRFIESRAAVGLKGLDVARLSAVDLNDDGHADLVLRPTSTAPARPRVFLWQPDPTAPLRGRFTPFAETGLPLLSPRDVLTFADLDNDGRTDAVVARYIDYLNKDFAPPAESPQRTAWLPGRGDGSFGAPRVISAALAATTAAVAVGDANRDGLPDLWLGNWYRSYLAGTEGFANDLLLQFRTASDPPQFARWSIPGETEPLDLATDPGGRPTYGALVAQLGPGPLPHLLELNYGRRWNRLYELSAPKPLDPAAPAAPRTAVLPEFAREEVLRTLHGRDIAPAAGFDGDAVRHGRHPEWLRERARTDPRFDRKDELPYRSNGNTFDAAVGDIDNDGDFDVFLTTIIHAWAGDSSDRSRFLVNQFVQTGRVAFTSPPALSIDRIPSVVTAENRDYNQGDIFAELADLDNDGRLDLVLCSSDYSDPPPHDERLRIYLQQPDGTFRDATAGLGIDQLGAGQPALLDFDHDGALDLIVGQSFNRLNSERRRAAGLANGTLSRDFAATAASTTPAPRLHVYHNRLAGDRRSLVLRLAGAPEHGIARDSFGAIVRVTADLDGDPATPAATLVRQLVGPGGHAGKRSDMIVHVGLGRAARAESVEIAWPNIAGKVTRLGALAPGTYNVRLVGDAAEVRIAR